MTNEERIQQIEREIETTKQNIRDNAAGNFTNMLKAELQSLARRYRQLKEGEV